MLVELACSTTLSPAYHPAFFRRLLQGAGKHGATEGGRQKVVFIVCGGVKISLDEYDGAIKASTNASCQENEIFCNGERWSLES